MRNDRDPILGQAFTPMPSNCLVDSDPFSAGLFPPACLATLFFTFRTWLGICWFPWTPSPFREFKKSTCCQQVLFLYSAAGGDKRI